MAPRWLKYATFAARLRERLPAHGHLLVCIDGAGGSGKSTLALALAAATGDAQVIHQDDFYRPRAERFAGSPLERPHGADFDLPRLRAEVLEPLWRGGPAAYRAYDWTADTLSSEFTRVTQRLVIVEGVYGSTAAQRSFFDLVVWVECPRPLRLARGLARDGELARPLWERNWMPGEDRYIAEERPADRADLVCDGSRNDVGDAVLVLHDRLT